MLHVSPRLPPWSIASSFYDLPNKSSYIITNKSSVLMASTSTWTKFIRQKVLFRFAYFYSGCVVISKYGGTVVFLTGDSMLPTIVDGDIVVTRIYNPKRHKIERGDIVCVKSPTDSKILLCKRVSLIEHDEDEILSKKIGAPARIAAGRCYLLGDNLEASSDSRAFGPIPMGLIYSRVVLRIWPLNRFGFLQ